MILLRTTEPSKKCLREAADRAGLTLTSFILRAALREAVGSDDAGILSRYLLQDGLAQDEIERAATHPFDALLQHAAVIDSSGIVKAYQESRANTPNDAGLDRRLDVPPPLNELAPAAARGGAVNYRKVGRVLAEHTLRYLGATNATAWWKRNADL